MNIFKIYGKIVSKNFLAIFIYIAIATAIAVLAYGFAEEKSPSPQGSAESKKTDVEFSLEKPKVTIINEDGDYDVIVGFHQIMNQYVEVVTLDYDVSIEDALFYGEVDYVIIIPKGLSEHIYAGGQGKLERLEGPDVSSYSGIYLDSVVSNYFDIWLAYGKSLPELPKEEILNYVVSDLSKEAEVTFLSELNNIDVRKRMSGFFNILSYACLASVIVSVGVTMGAFSKKGIKRKLFYAPVNKLSFYSQMIIANLGLSTNIWGIGVMVSFIVFKRNMLSDLGLFLIGNYFIFSLCCLSIAFLVFHLFEDRLLIIGAANFIAVAMSFMGGVMVSQDMFNSQAMAIGNFVPVYWFVKANNIARDAAEITVATLKEISYPVLMQVGLTAAALSVALVIAKQKAVAEN